jgi:glycine/D-amino acid oxidase-like deaminating enzyme
MEDIELPMTITTSAKSKDAVIIGGGIIGAACADALSSEGMHVGLVERLGLAAGASSACQSGVGFGISMNDYTLRLHLAAVKAYQEFTDDGTEVDYRHDGTVLVGESNEETELKAGLQRLQKKSVTCEWLDQAALREAEPAISPKVTGAAWFKDTGQVSPMRVVNEMAHRASQRGAEIHTNTELTGIEVTHGKVTAAVTSKGRIPTETIIIAAGAWSRHIGKLVGLRVPVWPLKGHVLVTEPVRGMLRHFLSETGYEATVVAMQAVEIGEDGPQGGSPQVAAVLQNLPSGQILVGSSREFSGFDREVNRDRLGQIAKRAGRLVPGLARLRIIRTYAGLRPWTPDGLPMVGRTQQAEGIVFATGHGGDGNTLALITARLVAELMTSQTTALDTIPLSPDRFDMNG